MSQDIKIAPSILSADFSKLGDEIREVESCGADIIHVDVMDGHFVPNLTIGPLVVKSIKPHTQLPLDVHLMIDEPIQYIDDFVRAGSDWITFHVEATSQVQETIDKIKAANIRVGMSVRPKTPVSAIEPYLKDLDLVLVMSVEPGFGGQSFMPDMMEKVKELRSLGFKNDISVDGGVNKETAATVIEAGANLLVAGSAVFGQEDRASAIADIRNARQLG